MTDNNHPITPPHDQARWWWEEACRYHSSSSFYEKLDYVAARAIRWGWHKRNASVAAELQKARDEELEACCEWLNFYAADVDARDLRTARRPKPPSLKEQALEQLSGIETCFRASYGGDLITDTIRRALESLPN